MVCTTMPGFSCAALIALRYLCTPGRWPRPDGLQIPHRDPPGDAFGVPVEKPMGPQQCQLRPPLLLWGEAAI